MNFIPPLATHKPPMATGGKGIKRGRCIEKGRCSKRANLVPTVASDGSSGTFGGLPWTVSMGSVSPPIRFCRK